MLSSDKLFMENDDLADFHEDVNKEWDDESPQLLNQPIEKIELSSYRGVRKAYTAPTSPQPLLFEVEEPRNFSRQAARLPRADTTPSCTRCGGVGYVVLDLPIGDPNFGKASPCYCHRHQQANEQSKSLSRLGSLSILKHYTFDTFNRYPAWLPHEHAKSLEVAYTSCHNFLKEQKHWLYLSGTYGCGKTHLAASLAHRCVELDIQTCFVLVPDLLDYLRATFNPDSEVSYDEVFEQVRSSPMLILDDLGAQSSSAWAKEKLFQILNHRYNAMLPTVITSNQRVEEQEPRLQSRLSDFRYVINTHISAPDYRPDPEDTANKNNLGSIKLYEGQTFHTFDVYRDDLTSDLTDNLHRTFDAAVDFSLDPKGWLILSGKHGCGKTHLAAAIANDFQERHKEQITFVMVPDLLDHLRATFDPQSATRYDLRFEQIRQTPLLILDDLGTESATPWAKEKLFQLLNYRYSALKPTVITTATMPDRLDPWLRTRVLDKAVCQWWLIEAPDYRRQRSREETILR